jgi:hypothetical protein
MTMIQHIEEVTQTYIFSRWDTHLYVSSPLITRPFAPTPAIRQACSKQQAARLCHALETIVPAISDIKKVLFSWSHAPQIYEPQC